MLDPPRRVQFSVHRLEIEIHALRGGVNPLGDRGVSNCVLWGINVTRVLHLGLTQIDIRL